MNGPHPKSAEWRRRCVGAVVRGLANAAVYVIAAVLAAVGLVIAAVVVCLAYVAMPIYLLCQLFARAFRRIGRLLYVLVAGELPDDRKS